MTRKVQNQPEDGKIRKRILKPAVEKKRRDRINQSLAELRRLLLSSTSDPRLQNPKIEKAEILDLAVEYLQKWTDGKRPSDGYSPLLNLESAGFQQCVSQVTSYIHKITPAQRASLVEGLTHHAESRQPDFNHKTTDTAASMDDSKEECPRLFFSSHSPFQPQSCSTPSHDYLSPPPSPWFSPSFPTFATSSAFPSFACHFSFPSSVSPPSSNTSFFSFSPSVPHFSPLPTLRPPSNPPHREGSAPNSSSPMWRPWF
ncbi:hairy-related 11 [Parambassis ranga]|uniref:Hairy-related 11 n=1 Tax=Parambassis ranga TaxID=210632 RepID=A0A6P7J7I5_9TELE|nr:transcription factor HES-7-like [Parambassis ranga]